MPTFSKNVPVYLVHYKYFESYENLLGYYRILKFCKNELYSYSCKIQYSSEFVDQKIASRFEYLSLLDWITVQFPRLFVQMSRKGKYKARKKLKRKKRNNHKYIFLYNFEFLNGCSGQHFFG